MLVETENEDVLAVPWNFAGAKQLPAIIAI